MDLGLYLFLTKIRHGDFAERIDVWPNTLSQFVHKHNTPTLFNALKIYYETGKKVDLISLLSEKERKYMQEKYGISKKDIWEIDI